MAPQLTDDQARSVTIAERVTSVLSLIGLTFIITTFIFSDKFRKPINRLMFYAAWGDALYNIATLVAMAGIHSGGDSGLCQFQGFVIEMYVISSSARSRDEADAISCGMAKHLDAPGSHRRC